MKAIVLEKAGSVENLVIKDVPKPVVGKNDVLIQTKALSVNPVDYKVRGNQEVLEMICGNQSSYILGWDVAGAVMAKGDEVTQFDIGDHVFGMVNFPGVGNAYAEFVAAPETQLAKIPTAHSFEEAAATTLAALTALQVLQKNVQKGDRILIHAGSGGVGHFAIQIAKALGAHVVTTSSAKNKDLVISLGADEHIDYRTQAFEDILSDMDFVFDMFNGDILLNSVKVVKEGGRIVSLPTPEFSDEILSLAKERNVTVSFQMVQSNGEDMQKLKEFMEKGALKPYIYKTYSFEQMAAAHTQLESGRTVGKVVVKL